ncbi:MAG TPA: hypothetical protein VGM52_12005 [Herbaspirillum sp.]|jgi:hypothetical protein
MTTTYKWIALLVLLSGASINMYIKDFNKADGIFFIFGHAWILYNFYACFFGKELLGPPGIDIAPEESRKYLRLIFVVLVVGGAYIASFF